jgi:hypothetical protein
MFIEWTCKILTRSQTTRKRELETYSATVSRQVTETSTKPCTKSKYLFSDAFKGQVLPTAGERK